MRTLILLTQVCADRQLRAPGAAPCSRLFLHHLPFSLSPYEAAAPMAAIIYTPQMRQGHHLPPEVLHSTQAQYARSYPNVYNVTAWPGNSKETEKSNPRLC